MTDPITRLNAALEGRYRIEREIGAGGMATVYLADDLRHERKVALKVLKPELAAMVGAERFLAEIKTTANLNHPHILPLHDSGEADGFLFFVMPYVEGETLRDRLDRDKQLPVDEAVSIARKVSSALQYAHTHGVVHRDIKPGNILLQGGEPVVADFGIALAVGVAGGNRLTETGLSVGTPYYMSPEQATGDTEVGPASDIYALSCVLFEMLTGDPPYVGSTAQAVLGKIIQGKPVSATEARRSVPSNVDAAIRKALEKLPADRFTGAQAFAEALADTGFRYSEGEGATVGAARAGIWKPLTWALAAAVVVLAAGLAWALTRPGPPAAVTRFEITTPAGVEAGVVGGVGLDVSPDGSRVVFTGVPASGSDQLWLRSADRLEPVPVNGTELARNPRFSPSGGAIAFTRGGTLSTVALAGTPPLVLVPDGVQDTGVSWGDDGFIYYRGAGSGISRVPATGGTVEELTAPPPEEGDHLWVEALPEGRGLLLTRNLGAPSADVIAVLSLETGELRDLFQGAMARYGPPGHLLYVGGEGNFFAVPFDLERLEVSGGAVPLAERVQLNAGSASYFAVSGSGALVYQPAAGAAGQSTIPVVVARDGSEEALAGPLAVPFVAQPAVSPDGRRVAFTASPDGTRVDVWVYDRDQETFSRLTFDEASGGPFWDPEGRDVGFVSTADGRPGIFARPADGSAPARLLRGMRTGAGIVDVLWTPDGEGLVFSGFSTQNGRSLDIFSAALDSAQATVTVLGSSFDEGLPSLSPDGRWLAYTSDESGRDEVYVRPFPGAGGQTQISIAGGLAPVWSRSGDEIFFYDSAYNLVVAGVTVGESVVVESRAVVTDREALSQQLLDYDAMYDVLPDDEGLIVISGTGVRRAGGGQGGGQTLNSTPVVVVQNFVEELKRSTEGGGGP